MPYWAEDPVLCGRWAEVYTLWKLAYPLMDLQQEIFKAYIWDRSHPGKVCNKANFLNNWLARAYPEHEKRHEEKERRAKRSKAADNVSRPKITQEEIRRHIEEDKAWLAEHRKCCPSGCRHCTYVFGRLKYQMGVAQ